MLIQFLCENYRSFKEEALLNLVPAKSRIHPDHVLVDEEKGKSTKAVPLALLYGANASGKSNLIRAMDFARKLIVTGTRGEQGTGAIPFRLDDECAAQPSRFEFVLKHEGVVYTYGFAVSPTRVHEEWLYAIYERREVTLFERKTEGEKAEVECPKLAETHAERQRLKFVAEGTRPNQLFLTEANERNVEKLKPLMHWFRNQLRILYPQPEAPNLAQLVRKKTDFSTFLNQFLGLADTGIGGISALSTPLDLEEQFQGMPLEIRKIIMDHLEKGPSEDVVIQLGNSFLNVYRDEESHPVLLKLKTQHKMTDGRPVDFETEDESDGTLRMMNLAPVLFEIQGANELVFVIDELDRSMHPLLCRLFVEAFLRGVRETGGHGQMIATTHQTSPLDLSILRRDEVWFVEKDESGGSHLTSLAEFKSNVRSDLKISKGYLNGRFGAIPFLGDLDALFPKSKR